MRPSAFAYATVAAGIGIAVAGAIAAVHEPLTALTLLGAAALAAELLEEPDVALARQPSKARRSRVAAASLN